ncbi:MAG: D-alanyl-D-alanine carboxypeptidase, partial [Pseudomonadota bacterium]
MIDLLKTALILVLVGLASACATPLRTEINAALTNPDQIGIHWGLVVADLDGTELLEIDGDGRFLPASNTKIVTTMASYHHLEALSTPRLNPGTRVWLEPDPEGGPPDLVVGGGGDAMLSDAADCEIYCLSGLADQIKARGLTEIGHVIGDDTFFPFERWGVGWGLEDVNFYYGTAISALSVNDNLVWVDVAPGLKEGDLAQAIWRPGDAVFELTSEVRTGAADSQRKLRIERFPGANQVRLYGAVPAGGPVTSLRLAINNPAELVARRLADHLTARGVALAGIRTRHRPLTLADEPPDPDLDLEQDLAPMLDTMPSAEATQAAALPSATLAHLPASPLSESLERISKDSQNLHADIALRRLGLLEGTGRCASVADGNAA